TQELQCLIIGLTSLWDQTSATWRYQASRILKAVSAVATSNTNCVRICIQNLLHITGDLYLSLVKSLSLNIYFYSSFLIFVVSYCYKIISCEEGVSLEQFQPVEELLALIGSFTLLGKTELKVALCVTNPQPSGFKFDPPLTKGLAVKNLRAFHLLQASLMHSEDSLLACQLLRTLQTIWERDPANFFLLEWTVQSVAQLATCVWRKPAPVQKLFFSLVEMALTDLGLLELLLGELRRRAKILRKAGVVSCPKMGINDCFISVRDLGMIPYIKIFLDVDQYRESTLSILEQLAEINPEEFMSTAIGALCSSTQQELGLKQDLLQSLLKVLESPNSWDAFRRAGGFTGLLSLVTDMEGALSNPPQGEVWKSLGHQPLVDHLLLTLHILSVVVHLHTANAHHFETGGFYEKLAEALLQLGCFHAEGSGREKWVGENFYQFVDLAESPVASASPSTPQPNLPLTLQTCIRLLSFLDQFATGTYSPQKLNLGPEREDGCDDNKRKSNGTAAHEGVYSGSPPAHLGSRAIRVIMTLLPSVFTHEDPQLSMEVQLSLAHHIQAMVKSERNRQIMCEGGLVSILLAHCQSMLLTPNHPLHLPVTRILEKLSSQCITPSDFRSVMHINWSLYSKYFFFVLNPQYCLYNLSLLRKFLCLGDPLMCLGDKTAKQIQSESIPVHQILSLVSMTSPRTFKPHRLSCSPAFVEFDMSESGYGCLFLPSLATVKGVTADSVSTGGIGGDCRSFPPTAGLSFTCWFQINRFSSACDSHPIRLLSVVRHMSRTEQQYICLSISFSAYDGCLVISTEEEALTYLDMMEPEAEVSSPTSLPTSLRFRCSSMLVPGQWHHLAVVMAKDLKKSCVTSAYFNGKAVGTGKMKYIQPFPGQHVSMDPSAVIDVYGVMGTPPLWKEYAAVVWRVGPSYLFEEALSSEAVGAIYTQGTAYLGNFLALRNTSESALVPEERISFGINPAVSTLTTVVQIREDYNEVDCRLIAKEMGITCRDQSTPVFLAQNISQHLSGTARTIGAALVGHFGVRTFTPSSASNGFLYVGGPAVVLSLVAMAPDDSSLYAAVKVLHSVLETNSAMQQEMNRINGYKLLAFLLKMKSSLVSHRTFQLVLHLTNSFEPGYGSGCLQKTPAFQALLCDLDNLNVSLFFRCGRILQTVCIFHDNGNAAVIHSVDMLPKLLFELCDPAVTIQKVVIISRVITSLLKVYLTLLLVLSQACLPCAAAQSTGPASLIWIRNQMLLLLCEILDQQKVVFDALGSDWFLFFLQPHLHPSTFKLGLILLTHFLSSPSQQRSFREGVLPGTLIGGMEEPFAVMDNLQANSWSHECVSTTCSGFDVLRELLIKQSHLPHVYEALAALLQGKKTSHTVCLDDILQPLIDNQVETPAQNGSCLITLLLFLQPFSPSKCKSVTDTSWESQLPASVMQFLCLIHNLRPRDPLWASPTFLHALAGVVFPLDISEVCVGARKCNIVSEGEDTVKSHQTQKPVLDFIRILLMDSLLNVSANTNAHPFVLLLEVNLHEYKLLCNVSCVYFFYFNFPDSSSERPEGRMVTLMENVVLFSQTLLLKLYIGTYLADCEILLNFLADQIVVVRQMHIHKHACNGM
uniref:Alfy-like armadillo-like repeat domain-containing protein n=1 Tax=Maylandia zebra TaxID=106582 RepID=A0A3P9B4G9_9CICH